MTKSEKVEFAGSAGKLAGRLELPAGKPRAYALFAHCFSCSKDALAATRIARGLTEEGIATLRFDFTGLGASEGDFANTSFSSNIEDLVAAAAFLRAEYRAPALLVGHSLGGAAVLAAAGKIREAKAVATIGAPFDPGHVKTHFKHRIKDIRKQGEAEINLDGRSFRVKKQFLDDLDDHDQKRALANLKRALLILHAPKDKVVGIDNAARIFEAARHPKSFVSLMGADHLVSDREDARYAARVIASWAARYLDLGEEEFPRTGLKAGKGDTLVAERGGGKFAQAVLANGHRLAADEPESYGGDDSGPSPYDLLLAALGSCTAMTIRMYADRKKLPLEKVAVRLSHEKIHAEDCRDCETKGGKVDQIAREIELTGGKLTKKQKQRMLEIADKCPVHRTLTSEVKIRTKLKA